MDEKVARRRRPAEAQRTRSLGLGYKLCAVGLIPVAGQRTHRPAFRALKVTCQVATPGAKSAVYECLVGLCGAASTVSCFLRTSRTSSSSRSSSALSMRRAALPSSEHGHVHPAVV